MKINWDEFTVSLDKSVNEGSCDCNNNCEGDGTSQYEFAVFVIQKLAEHQRQIIAQDLIICDLKQRIKMLENNQPTQILKEST
jgi:hypothetical protein